MNSISVILTARDTGDRLSLKGEKVFKSGIGRQDIDLELYPDTRYQKIIGFGGAFTEAAAYTLSKISSDKRLKIIESYFDRDKGLGYNMGRVHINSCDFALENYTYVEDGDRELKTFDISRERQWVIPLIRDAIKARGGEIKLLASPWSPPAWMKSNEKYELWR